MTSFKDLLESKNIMISLHNFGPQDLGTAWEVKAIVENKDIFIDFYSRYPLTEISCLDDYYLYLLSLKFVGMRDVIPVLLQDEHKRIISNISDNAEKAIEGIEIGDVIKFINENIQIIFDKERTSHDIQFVTIDLIAKYNGGISKDVFEFLCKNYGNLIIDRFEQFEKTFEQYPELFDFIYPTGHLEEINSFRLGKTLDIWCHVIKKGKSSLKEAVTKRVITLAEDIKIISETATIDNVFQVEMEIREFLLFLQRIQSPLANEFAGYEKRVADLLSKRVLETGQSFQYEIPVGEIIKKWKNIEEWENRLLMLTHDSKEINNTISCVSRLSIEPESKNHLFDLVSTNIPTDDYYTMSHQQKLLIMASIGTGTMMGIIKNHETLTDYLILVTSSISFISQQMNAEGDQIQQDVKMFSALVSLVADNSEINIDAARGLCYGTSMFACSLAEKILRILYMQLAKDEKYIPIEKATLGELLVTNNAYITSVFGENHIKNLAFFLQRTPLSNVGQNIRNSLAHWGNISTEEMTLDFVAKVLWIFTDILNTVFWYCLEKMIDRDELKD